MTLTPEQKKAVSEWVAAGDSLYAVQKKLSDQFKISMTYMDVRFLVDDLNLQLKDPEPKADASDVSKGARRPPRRRASWRRPRRSSASRQGERRPPRTTKPTGPAPVGRPRHRRQGEPESRTPWPAARSRFGDGVTGKWMVDHQGRPGAP